MAERARAIDTGLVDIARDFLAAHRQLRQVALRHREGRLEFAEVRSLVGDDERAVLFRLKERCHALFRGRGGSPEMLVPEQLFDLAVGSLFHEAMKYRENLYQRDAYGPKVRALRRAAVPDEAGLLQEFEKILRGADARLDEALEETEILLAQTTDQFRLLLRAHASSGVVARYLLREGALVEEAFGLPLDDILAEVHGSAAAAFAQAARSYLESGFFAEARPVIEGALARGAPRTPMERLRRYAEGMTAYLEGRFGEALESLSAWVEAGPGPDEARFASLAHAAVSRVGSLVERGQREALGSRATTLAERIRPLAGDDPPPRAAVG